MSTYSTYKELEKPLSTEKYNVAVFNKNTDVIDSELHKLDLKNQSQDNLLATKEELNSEINRAITAETIIQESLSDHNTSAFSHNDIRNLISELTSRLKELIDNISFEFETEPIDFLTEFDTNLEMNEEQ